MTTTEPQIPACPNPHLYAFTTNKRDRRTKTGWRLVEEYTMEFADERLALQHAQDVEGFRPDTVVEYRKVWVLKQNFMSSQPGFPQYYWEEWNTPYCCSPSSELYWTM